MTVNVGKMDRILRTVVGIVLLIAAMTSLSGGGQIVAILVGVVMIATAGMRFCPAYRLLGINTCKV